MKQVAGVCCVKAVIAGLFLLLVHTCAVAQETDTIPAEADTIVYPDTTVVYSDTLVEEYPQVVYSPDDMYKRVLPFYDSSQAVSRAVPANVISRLQKDKDFEYANDPAYWKREKPKENKVNWLDWVVSQRWLQYVFVGLLIAAVLFALYRLLVSNRMLLFTRSKGGGMAGEEEMVQAIDLPGLIQEAEQQGNFRQAVRYRYMKTLQDMNGRGMIRMTAQSTNWDYVNQLKEGAMKKTFLLLTRAYEYVWYGEFELDAEQYSFLKTEFLQFENVLRA